MMIHLNWTPRDIKEATRFELDLAIEGFTELHGDGAKLDDETVERLKGLKYGKS
tara:strand:- start:245 stop:406 length:162 start_codon:yes stop_codon:yes gene_type:complete